MSASPLFSWLSTESLEEEDEEEEGDDEEEDEEEDGDALPTAGDEEVAGAGVGTGLILEAGVSWSVIWMGSTGRLLGAKGAC